MALVVGAQYASATDLANLGLVGAALANVATSTQNAALVAASAVADSYFESRFALPLASYGNDVVRAVAVIAAYDIMTSRGYNPMAGADQNIRQRYLDAIAWLQAVKNGEQNPAYLVDANGAGAQPENPDDGSVSASAGGFGITTSTVRGWTERGVNAGAGGPFNPWDI